MAKFAANLSMLFTEVDFMDLFEAAAEAGFQGVEYLFPYAFDADEIKQKLDANNLEQVLFNLPAGDWDAGDRGIAVDPAKAIIKEVASDNLSIQYDIYHMQIMEGDLTLTMQQNISQIAHVQLADNPARHEPGTGEINYPFVLNYLDELGYQGWVGCEYKPKTTTTEGLGWLNQYR